MGEKRKGLFDSSRPKKEGYLPGVHDYTEHKQPSSAKTKKTDTDTALEELRSIEDERVWEEKARAAKEGQAELAELSDEEINKTVENLGK